ncbi:uncharacterized protein TM35_000821060 [Trypanosoma theileri]|uniref:Mucin-associated surface protein (MASP) n=1 Tax=Trypanosoma theileri TaxID=67003 RepID=A0A1X0NFF1_9TRYP|nr:uncharacterized protein TM35_000821060 [Trypanosoma theileri]ORC82816.1 hypothetical protein TM35_000821060 [Trypanosoma theileri]
MTTMFVQLRRVVYLLVLLHFCTCVVYARRRSGDGSTTVGVAYEERISTDNEEISQKMRDSTAKMEEKKKKTEITADLLGKERERYNSASNDAERSVIECTQFAKEIEDGLKNVMDNDNENQAEELVKKCTDAAQEVKKVAASVKSAADAAHADADKLLTAVKSGRETSNGRLDSLDLLKESEISSSLDKFKEAVTAVDKTNETEKFATEVQKNVTAAKAEVAKAEQLEQAANDAAKLLQEAIQKAKTAAAAKAPAAAEPARAAAAAAETTEKAAEVEQQQNVGSAPKNEEQHEKQTTEAESSSESQINKNEENRSVTMVTKNSSGNETNKNGERGSVVITAENEPNTEKNISTVEQQNDQHARKENSRGGGSTNESETTKNSTVAEILKSQNMLTNSPSTGSVPLNVTQFIDSSSSPALVHSPLLLLLVSMCVLGCTVVC